LYRKFTIDRDLSLFSNLRVTLTAKQNKNQVLRGQIRDRLSSPKYWPTYLECLANIKDHFPSTDSINEGEREIRGHTVTERKEEWDSTSKDFPGR